MDESRRFDEDFGFLAHRVALTGDSNIDERHGSGTHHRNLQKRKTHLGGHHYHLRQTLSLKIKLQQRQSIYSRLEVLAGGSGRPITSLGYAFQRLSTSVGSEQRRAPPRFSRLLQCRHAFRAYVFTRQRGCDCATGTGTGGLCGVLVLLDPGLQFGGGGLEECRYTAASDRKQPLFS